MDSYIIGKETLVEIADTIRSVEGIEKKIPVVEFSDHIRKLIAPHSFEIIDGGGAQDLPYGVIIDGGGVDE